MLTAGADTLDPLSATVANKTSSDDDAFRAPKDGFLTSADYVDGGAGYDSLTASVTAAGQTLAPVLKNIECITLTVAAVDTKATTFNAADTTGATTVSIKDAGAVSMATSDEKNTVSNLAKTTTPGIIGGAPSTGTTAKTVEITATGTGVTSATGANTIGSLVAGAAKTLNIKGAGDLTIAASDIAAIVRVNASVATGKIAFTSETAATSTTFTGGSGNTSVTTASTGTISVTTGTGNDTVDISGSANTAAVAIANQNATKRLHLQSAHERASGGEKFPQLQSTVRPQISPPDGV